MELWQEIMCKILQKEEIDIRFPQVSNPTELLHEQWYKALREIQRIFCDDTLSDPECYQKIEAIVCVLEDKGSNAGSRYGHG